MVDYYGVWTPEKDYKNYPKEKWCDMDRIANWIIESGYEVKTSIEHLTIMIALHFSNPDNFGEYNRETGCGGWGEYFTFDKCKEYVEASGGFKEFDYAA